MEKKHQISKKKIAVWVSCVASLTVLLFACVYMDSVSVMQEQDGEQVAWAKAGTVATFTVKGHIEVAQSNTASLVIAFLAPKSWNIRQNANVTYTEDYYEPGVGEQAMTAIPASTLPKNQPVSWGDALTAKYGVGPNILKDMEWVAFASNKSYSVENTEKANYVVYIRCNVGTQNLRFRPGFFVNTTDDGLSTNADYYKVMFANECFEVVEGEGAVIDYCSEHFNKVAPLAALQDDYLTFSFVGGVADNELKGADNIYLQATAVSVGGTRYTVNEKSAKTLMKRENRFSDTYNLTVWPGGFFDLPADEEIVRIEYLFTNADNSITITESDDKLVMENIPIEGEKNPFVFDLSCK
jgi:hypothetical protein